MIRSSRRRYCVARVGCTGRPVTYVPAPRGTVGRVSACAACWERVTGQQWGAAQVQAPAVVVPVARQVPARRILPPRFSSGRAVSPSHEAKAQRQAISAAERVVTAVSTRLLWWLMAAPVSTTPWGPDAAACLGVEEQQVRTAMGYLRRQEWVQGRTVTEAGKREAARRRELQARLGRGEPC